MALSPVYEDSRLHRFPKNWFSLPWEERNKKFNELINSELERTREYLNNLTNMKDYKYKRTASRLSSRGSGTSRPTTRENTEQVDAKKLIKELDLLIKAGEKLEDARDKIFEGNERKKKLRKSKRQTKDKRMMETESDSILVEPMKRKKVKMNKKSKEQSSIEEDDDRKELVQPVKSLEDHLKDFLGYDAVTPWRGSSATSGRRRPPGRHGDRCGGGRVQEGAGRAGPLAVAGPPAPLLPRRGRQQVPVAPAKQRTNPRPTALSSSPPPPPPPAPPPPTRRPLRPSARPPPRPVRLPPLPMRLVPTHSLILDSSLCFAVAGARAVGLDKGGGGGGGGGNAAKGVVDFLREQTAVTRRPSLPAIRRKEPLPQNAGRDERPYRATGDIPPTRHTNSQIPKRIN